MEGDSKTCVILTAVQKLKGAGEAGVTGAHKDIIYHPAFDLYFLIFLHVVHLSNRVSEVCNRIESLST